MCSLGYRIASIGWYDKSERQFWFTGDPLWHLSFYLEGCQQLLVPGRLPMRTMPTVESTSKRGSQRPLIAYGLERATLLFSIKMALAVWTLLAVINHGQAIVTGHFTSDRLLPLLLSYCVPFSVAMYSQIQGKRQRDRFQAEVSAATMQTAMKPTDDERPGGMQGRVIRNEKGYGSTLTPSRWSQGR